MDDSEAKTERKHYMPALDGLRAIACLLVVWAHANPLLQISEKNFDSGACGVILFFCLSGFLMGTLYVHKPAGLDNIVSYLIARFSRITPAYYIAITVAFLTSLMIADQHYHMDPSMLVRSYLFMGSAGVFWSIPPEIQFYLFFLLMWGGYHRARGGQYALMVLVIMLSFIFIETRDLWGGIMLPSKYHVFLSGFLGAFFASMPVIRRISGRAIFQAAILVATLGYLYLSLGSPMFLKPQPSYDDLVLPLLMAVLVASFSSSSVLTRPLEWKFMRIMGNASFSIYLFHDILLRIYAQPLLNLHLPVLVNLAVIILVSVLIPVAFHFLIESPLHHGSKKLAMNFYTHLRGRWFQPRQIPV